jgi:hypothetical protein
MSDTRPSLLDVTTSDSEPTGWVGWVAFASSMMILLGIFQAIEGLVGIFDDGYYRVGPSGLVVDIDYTAWGWAHLLLGLLIVASGVGVLSGNVAAARSASSSPGSAQSPTCTSSRPTLPGASSSSPSTSW